MKMPPPGDRDGCWYNARHAAQIAEAQSYALRQAPCLQPGEHAVILMV
jgi:hypothetical protein